MIRKVRSITVQDMTPTAGGDDGDFLEIMAVEKPPGMGSRLHILHHDGKIEQGIPGAGRHARSVRNIVAESPFLSKMLPKEHGSGFPSIRSKCIQ